MGAGMRLRKYGIQATIDFEVFDTDGVDLNATWVPAQVDCEIMKDGGSSTLCDNTATDEGVTFSIVLTATEMEFARGVLKVQDAATKVILDTVIHIETYGNASAQHAFDLDTARQEVDLTYIHGSALTETSGQLAAAFVKLFNVGTPTLVASSVMRGTDSAALASNYTAARAGYLDELAAANMPADLDAVLADTNELQTDWANGGRLDVIIDTIKAVTDDMKVLDTTIASVDTPDTVFRVAAGLTGNDDINNAVCSIYDTTGGIWSGPRRVTDYVHGTLQITIDANTAFPLAAADRVVIWNVSYATTAAAGSITQGDLDDIADAVWEELQADHLTELTTGAKQNVSDRVGR